MALRTRKDLSKMTAAQLRNYIQAYGKTVNERIASLERAGVERSSVAYRYITEKDPNRYKYLTTSKSGRTKIEISTRGLDRNELLSKASTLQNYLNARTSTVGGVKKSYKRGYKTFMEHHPNSKLTEQEYRDLVTHEKWKQFDKSFGSKRLIAIAGRYGIGAAVDILENMDKVHSIREANKKASDYAKNERTKGRKKGKKFEEVDENESPFKPRK